MSDDNTVNLEDEAVQAAIDAKAKELAADLAAQETEGLLNKNRELLGEVKQAKSRLKRYSNVPEDFDPEELEQLRGLRAEIEEKKAKAEGDWTKLREDLVTRHTSEMEAVKAERDAARSELDTCCHTCASASVWRATRSARASWKF